MSDGVQAIGEDDLLFREKPLVAAQHSSNKQEVLACSNCFRFVGPMETQLAWRLSSEPAAGAPLQQLAFNSKCLDVIMHGRVLQALP